MTMESILLQQPPTNSQLPTTPTTRLQNRSTMAYTKIHNQTPQEKPKNIQYNNLHHILHPNIIKVLINSFKITHSYYSFPLTCPIQLTQYNSPHYRDVLFGFMRHVKSSCWTRIGLEFPRDHNTTLEAIHWTRMAAKEDTHTTTILITCS